MQSTEVEDPFVAAPHRCRFGALMRTLPASCDGRAAGISPMARDQRAAMTWAAALTTAAMRPMSRNCCVVRPSFFSSA